MNARTRALTATAALALGLGLTGTGTAHAKPNPPDRGKTGCTHEGRSYPPGSTRGLGPSGPGRDGTGGPIYQCQGGVWVSKGLSRTEDPAENDATKHRGAPPRR